MSLVKTDIHKEATLITNIRCPLHGEAADVLLSMGSDVSV